MRNRVALCGRGIVRRFGIAGVLAAVVVASAPIAAQAAPSTRDVAYLGYHFIVPSEWGVVNLAQHPSTCVRYDQHTLYLGTPSATQDCPNHAVGRTEAILVQPATSAPSTWGTTNRAIDSEYDVAANRVRVTATYGMDQNLIASILAHSGLPATAPAHQATAPAAMLSPSVALGASVYAGAGFDACSAPSEGAMNAWRANSPYDAVGIYFGGSTRSCDQPNLTSRWMQDEAANGWHFMPIYAGVQAGGISSPNSQGVASANDAVVTALSLGLPQGTPLYYDMEGYAPNYKSNVLAFLAGWTRELQLRGYLSGVYSSGASGITDLVSQIGTGYPEPDVIWDAHANGDASTNDSYLPAGDWAFHQRIHQYSLGHGETYGGVNINIDQDYLDVGPSNTGPLYYDTSNAQGDQGWKQIGGANGAGEFDASRVAVAGMPNGDTRMIAYGNDENMYQNIQFANDTWQGWQLVQGAGGAGSFQGGALGIAATPNGDAQLVAIGNDGNIWHDVWTSGNTWDGWGEVQGVGGALSFQATSVAIAGMPDNDAQIVAVGNDGNLYHDIRLANKNWQGWGQVRGAGGAGTFSASTVAISAMSNGDAQVIAVGNDGFIYDTVRYAASGNWQDWIRLSGAGGADAFAASAIAIGTMTNDDAQILAVGNDGDVYRMTRLASTSFTDWAAVPGANGASAFAARRVAITGESTGSAYLVGIGG
ncbi:MAG TPA: glycoside hydrolase domain-containing protein [Pseudonocardiaceae bacterium]